VIVDCAIHPALSDEALAEAIGPPWNLADLAVPSLFGDQYEPPFDPLVAPVEDVADAAFVARALLQAGGRDAAILTPSTRGYFPNPQQAAAFARASNSLLQSRWLDDPAAEGRFLGSIRVAVNDSRVAVREIETWAADTRFVQVVVPLRSLAPYGDERYFPIWRAAVEHGLPVFVHDDLGTLVEPTPTPVGYPRHFPEYHALRPTAAVVHLASLITCGVFGRLPELRFVFGDLGVDLARALLWRVDKDWRSDRVEIPWVTERPSSFPIDHVRFVSQPEDDPAAYADASEDVLDEWASLVVFGSRYPYWDCIEPTALLASCPSEVGERVSSTNALSFYPRLPVAATQPADR
jgi:uncharacterized protein